MIICKTSSKCELYFKISFSGTTSVINDLLAGLENEKVIDNIIFAHMIPVIKNVFSVIKDTNRHKKAHIKSVITRTLFLEYLSEITPPMGLNNIDTISSVVLYIPRTDCPRLPREACHFI